MLETIARLGRMECGKASDDDVHLLRLLTPILKLHTAKTVMNILLMLQTLLTF